MRKVVFVDRDGTLSKDEGYTARPEDLDIFPGSGHAVGLLKSAGYAVVVVTNQSAIGRGYASVADVEATNAECLRQLTSEDEKAVIDAVLYCPHTPDDKCGCRKPLTGMVEGLRFEFSKEGSWLVGDKLSDLRFGFNLGLKPEHCVLVRTGGGAADEQESREALGKEFHVFENIRDAAAHIAAADKKQ